LIKNTIRKSFKILIDKQISLFHLFKGKDEREKIFVEKITMKELSSLP